MTSPILNMLLGAALVAIGVLAAALADRIRGLRVSREQALEGELFLQTRGTVGDGSARTPAPSAPSPMEAFRPVKPTAQRAEIKARHSTDGAEDVVAALVAAGYKKQIAADAALACNGTERATIEDWTRAALRRCARGVS